MVAPVLLARLLSVLLMVLSQCYIYKISTHSIHIYMLQYCVDSGHEEKKNPRNIGGPAKPKPG